MQTRTTPGWVRWVAVLTLAGVPGCVAQRDQLDPSERRTLERNIADGVGAGEPREGSWPAEAQDFRLNLEVSSSCDGLLSRTQIVLARAWVSPLDDASPIPVLSPRTLDLQMTLLNGLFAGAVFSDARPGADHVYELDHALDGSALSDPCGCAVVAASVAGIPSFKSRMVSKRLICPEGMSYEPPEEPK